MTLQDFSSEELARLKSVVTSKLLDKLLSGRLEDIKARLLQAKPITEEDRYFIAYSQGALNALSGIATLSLQIEEEEKLRLEETERKGGL